MSSEMLDAMADMGMLPDDAPRIDMTAASPLLLFTWADDIVGVRVSIAEGADVNEPGDQGWRPLHMAASRGNREIYRLLLDKGADETLRNAAGELPGDLWETGS